MEWFHQGLLEEILSIHTTALIRKNIIKFKQEPSEPFWRYFERFKDLLVQCSHHEIEKWRQCQIAYDGLEYSTRTLLETMCQGGILRKDEN